MVIAYLRVGTSNKELLEEQKNEIKRYASDHDINVDKWVTDITVDKGKEDERNLTMVLDRMEKGDSLILSDISRLGRTLSEVMEIMGRCMEKGVQIYSIKDRYILDRTLNLPVMGNVFKLVTEIEHSLMSTRTKEALNHKKSTGGPLGRPKGSAAKQSFLDANKEEVISMLERGDTVMEICKRFNVSRNTYYMFKRNYGL
ncbi:recombinase family protein [uncultured Parabacteroides sp.]|uniref:recombinase family protein n=1 Tax=uncultured Parabacteroides sp. TaxID=512312 RepID=UPI00261A8603|nr:recombinase family protein [uncultured Parabacteroides sp.]